MLIWTTLPLGITYSIVVLVGKKIGEVKVTVAKRYYRHIYVYCIIASTVSAMFFCVGYTPIGSFFAHGNDAIHKLIDDNLIFFTVLVMFKFWDAILRGTHIALGM